MSAAGVIRLAADRIDEAGAVLARAFLEDPLQRYVLPRDEERARRSPEHFTRLLRLGYACGAAALTTAGEIQGVAVWLPPGVNITNEQIHASGLDRLDTALGRDAADRFLMALDYAAPLHARDVPRKHWYLMVIGVDPTRQRTGVGASLIRPILARADADGVACYLETAQVANIGFYQRLGFHVMVDTIEPTSGVRLWTFRRDARGRLSSSKLRDSCGLTPWPGGH